MYDDILRQISTEYERKRDRHNMNQIIRQNEIYKEVPAIKAIDDEIYKVGLRVSRNILGNPDNYEKIATEGKKRIEELTREKAYLMTETNYPTDYMDIKYECEKCEDTGYLRSGNRCSCLQQSLVSKAYEMSNIEEMIKDENFSTFDINVFSEEPFEEEELSPRENMINIVGLAEGFVNNFDEKNGQNLLFYGRTGLGKTFLSNCIAKSLLDRNKIVVYQTAFTILDIMSKYRFERGENKLNTFQYDLLFDADLLIVDDLGTELSNAFTNAEIFNVVNTRIIRNKKTIISTNLTPKEISRIYTERVFSRVFDKFLPLKFYGKDLRWE